MSASTGQTKRVVPYLRETLGRRVPALDVLREYSWGFFSRDLFAGVTVATVAVPQAMAYALIAGIHPQYGLYTAIVMTLVGALLASSRQLINGPTNAISIAVLSAVAVFPQGDRVAAVAVLTILVGLIQVGIVLLRMGRWTQLVSHSVIVGFTLGAGVLLAMGQVKHLLGLAATADHHEHGLFAFYRTVTTGIPHLWTTALGVGTAGLILGVGWLKRNWHPRHRFLVPEFLLAMLLASFLVWACDLQQEGVAVVGSVPAQLPSFHLPTINWSYLTELSDSALAIAVLGLLEAMAMSRAIAVQTRQPLDVDQQCLSEGVANCVGGIFQCLPGSGSLTRSIINQQAGAATQWSGVISAIMVALTVLFLAPFTHYIPSAALAGMLMVAAWRMVDWKEVRSSIRTPNTETCVLLVTAFTAVFISVEFCILLGVVLSLLSKGGQKLWVSVMRKWKQPSPSSAQSTPLPRLMAFTESGTFRT